MGNIKKLTFAVLLISFVFAEISYGQTSSFEINANSSDVEAKLNTQVRLYETPLNLGAGALYSDHDYFIFNINAMIKDAVFVPALTLGLGFKALAGDAEVHKEDFDLGALAFVVTGEYDFRANSSNLPISACVSASWAPHSLSFADTDRYVDFTFSVYAYVVQDAAIVVGYRNIDARFDNHVREKKSDDALFFGCKLVF